MKPVQITKGGIGLATVKMLEEVLKDHNLEIVDASTKKPLVDTKMWNYLGGYISTSVKRFYEEHAKLK